MNIIFTVFKSILNLLYNFTGDYGISIICLTFIVKCVFIPLNIKQKKAMENQKEISQKIEYIKEKYKNNKNKLEEELKKLYLSNSGGMVAVLPMLLQIPVMFSLYKVFSTMVVEAGTKLVPWVSSLSHVDPYFILPLIGVLIQTLPNILGALGVIKNTTGGKMNVVSVIMISIFGMMFLVKAPVAIVLYIIASSVYSSLEQIGYSIYFSKKCVA